MLNRLATLAVLFFFMFLLNGIQKGCTAYHEGIERDYKGNAVDH